MQINQNFNDYIYLPSIPRFQIFHISNMLFLQYSIPSTFYSSIFRFPNFHFPSP